jgi:hypothetical protein
MARAADLKEGRPSWSLLLVTQVAGVVVGGEHPHRAAEAVAVVLPARCRRQSALRCRRVVRLDERQRQDGSLALTEDGELDLHTVTRVAEQFEEQGLIGEARPALDEVALGRGMTPVGS